VPQSATTPTSVLVVGATGMLGGRIAATLSAMPQVQLRLLVRPDSPHDPRQRAALTALAGRGASIVEGDLAQRLRSRQPRQASRW